MIVFRTLIYLINNKGVESIVAIFAMLLCFGSHSVVIAQSADAPSIDEIQKQLEQKKAAKRTEAERIARELASREAEAKAKARLAEEQAARAAEARARAETSEFVASVSMISIPAGTFKMGDLAGEGYVDEPRLTGRR